MRAAMRVETFSMSCASWSAQALPDIDARDGLVLVFAAPSAAESPALFEDLRRKYPEAHIVGCSTSGEIAG